MNLFIGKYLLNVLFFFKWIRKWDGLIFVIKEILNKRGVVRGDGVDASAFLVVVGVGF